MSRMYDVYNLDEDLDMILEDLANETDDEVSYVRECYSILAEREGFIDFVRTQDDGLFYECLYDLVLRTRLAQQKMSNSEKTKSGDEYSYNELINSFNYEFLQESIDNAIYNSYGLEAKRFLSDEYLESLGYDDSRFYEDFGVSRQGKVIVFQGGAPKDAFKAE